MPRLDHPALESLLKKLGQEHLLDHWPRLSAANQTAFAEELAAVDWELVREVCAEKYAAADEKNGSRANGRSGGTTDGDALGRPRGQFLGR